MKFFTSIIAGILLFSSQCLAQNESNAPVLYEANISGALRSLRQGTFSNRTTNGANNGLPPKNWTFHDMTSWDSRFYNGRQFTNGAMTAGSNILTSATANFTSADIGKMIEVVGAGTSAGGFVGIPLMTSISSVQSTTQVTLAQNATVSVTGAIFRYGFKEAYTEGHYTTYSNGNFEMNYRLLFPANYNENEDYKYPMIVFIHGAGERGNCWGGSCFFNDNTLSFSNGSVTTNSNVLNCPTASFTANDINDVIRINFGPGGATIETRITAVNSSTSVVLAANSSMTSTNRSFTYGFGSGNQYRNNDLSLVHGGQTHLEAIHNPTTGSNGKKAEDPTLPARAFPGFVLIPQNENGWLGAAQYEQVYRIIELLIQSRDVDPDRIYMHGLSNGGSGAWEILRARPDLFSAILPMSATISQSAEIFTSEINKAVPIPAWIFQGGTDTNPTPNNTNQLVTRLRNAGAMPRYKIYPTVGHGTWGNAYNEPDFFSWMLKQNKRNINVLFGDSTLCGTNNNGVRLALGTGFLAYQWELNGAIIPGATTNQYTAMQPGTYRARFSRISANPSEAQWNAWSKPVVIRQSPPVVPVITALSTSHLPDINGGNSVTINTPVSSVTKNWYRDNILTTNLSTNPPTDTASSITRTVAGKTTLKTISGDGCVSLESNPVFVTLATPVTITAPTNLTATVTSPGSALLSWTDNSSDETNFELYRSTNPAGPYNFFQLLPSGTVSYTNTGLSPNTTYYYQVRAVNDVAVSAYTPNTSLTTETDTQPPSVPQNLIVSEKGLTSLVLTWTASTDNTGIGNYIIETGNGTAVGSTGSSLNEFAVIGLTPNTNYTFRVKAVDLAGNISQPSAQLLTNTTFTGVNYSHSAAFANFLSDGSNFWNDPEETGTRTNFLISPRIQDTFFNFKFEGYISLPAGSYDFRTTSDDGSAIYLGAEGATTFPFSTTDFAANRIYNNDGVRTNNCRNNDGGNTFPGYSFSGTSFRPITVLMFQQEFSSCLTVEYRLRPSGAWTTIPTSVLTSGTPPVLTPPAAPTGLTAIAAGMSGINLNWNTVASAEYEVYRSTNNVTFNMIARTTTNSFGDTGLNPSTLYYYRLRSVNSNGSSAFSSTASATTGADTQAPTVPQNVTILSSNYTNAGLTWSDCTDNVAVAGYRIYANGVLIGTSPNNSFYTTTLQPATLYNFTVSAIDTAPVPNESAQSVGVATTTNNPLTFYSKPSSDLTQLTSWTTNQDGSGTSPTSFSFDGQYFTIQNAQTLANPLNIGGSVSRVIVADNVTLNISQPLAGNIRVGNNAVVNINTDFQPVFETVATNSTVNFNTYSSIPAASYGNLVLNGSGLKGIAAGTVEVKGDLTLANGVGLQGASYNGSTIRVLGNLITGSSVATAPDDNRVNLQFSSSAAHNITFSNDISFAKITNESNASVALNNTSGSSKTITLGTLNGGGLDLANGSSFNVGTNNLNLTGKSVVNPTNTTGKISINRGNISITTSSTSDHNFYFVAGNNKVETFTIQSDASAIVRIREAVEVFNGIKINRGTLNSNGFITLKSSATSTAAIQQITNGSITGNVRVERYFDAKRVYRYISTPVSGVTVANWQAFFPITGSFTGASTGTGLGTNPSLFFYTEPNYIAYPTTNNSAVIQSGRGYAAFIRDGVNPTTLVQTGVPNQGNFTFTLTGGTGAPANGWNLLGNPYASDIVWSNTGWTSSGVGNVVSVRENLPGGGVTWRIWDRSTNTGNLPNGQIPAGQGFWIQTSTSNPSLVVTESAKTNLPATSNNNFFRSSDSMPNNVLAIGLSNGSQNDVTYIKLSNNGTDTYDKLSDGAKNQNSFFNISTLSADSVDLAVNELSNEFCEKNIQIKLATIAPGSYTMQFDNSDKFNWAQVQLIDRFTNTTQSLTESSSQYSFSVTTDLASYANRFLLKLTRPSIITNNQIISNKDVFCASESFAVVEVKNSQSGVEYQATNAQGQYLSTVVTGNGEAIRLTIPVNKLAPNANTIQVKASFSGCNSVQLTNQKSISVYALPSITTPATVAGCLGGTLDLKASGDGVRYEWINASSGEVLPETTNTLHISTINALSGFQVASFNSIGCKSEPAQILVRADSLATPSISMEEGALLTAPANNIQWLWNGEAIAGANDIRFTPTLSGNYTVQANSVYCSKVSAPYLVTASEDSNSNGLLVTVFPNPSQTGMVNIKGSSDIKGSLALSVTNLVGREVIVQSISFEDFSSGVELQHKLAPGVYIFKATLGNRTAHHKVIVR